MNGGVGTFFVLLIGVCSVIWLIRRSETRVRGQLTEPGNYRVVLQVAGNRVVAVMKEIRRSTDVSVKDARELVLRTPSILIQGVSRRSADQAVARLQALGARAVAVPMEDYGPRTDWTGDVDPRSDPS